MYVYSKLICMFYRLLSKCKFLCVWQFFLKKKLMISKNIVGELWPQKDQFQDRGFKNPKINIRVIFVFFFYTGSLKQPSSQLLPNFPDGMIFLSGMAYGASGGAFSPTSSADNFGAPSALSVRTIFVESWIWQGFSNERWCNQIIYRLMFGL